MNLANHCAAFPGLSLMNTRALVTAVIFSGQNCNLVSANLLERDEFQIVDGVDDCPFGSGVDQMRTVKWLQIVHLYSWHGKISFRTSSLCPVAIMRKLCSSNAHFDFPERMRGFVHVWGKLCWYSLFSSVRGYVCARLPNFIRAVRIYNQIITWWYLITEKIQNTVVKIFLCEVSWWQMMLLLHPPTGKQLVLNATRPCSAVSTPFYHVLPQLHYDLFL
jgi:hypothetical protein